MSAVSQAGGGADKQAAAAGSMSELFFSLFTLRYARAALSIYLQLSSQLSDAGNCIWDGHGDASGPLRQAHRPILNADGSLSEFPFVLTWFPIPEWDDSESDEEGPSPAGAESEEPESEPESEDDREIPDDEYW